MEGTVISGIGGIYTVFSEGQRYDCAARGKIRRVGSILVGDKVCFVPDKDGGVIESVLPRRNKLIRPYVANVDVMLIIIAPEPEPLEVMVDKMLINCAMEGIQPILVVNKAELDGGAQLVKRITEEYSAICTVTAVSAKTGQGLEELKALIKGKITAFAGQSAVGKSSLINALQSQTIMQTGELSARGCCGKNTTRAVNLILAGDLLLVDTCGFNEFLLEIPPMQLKDYYEDFMLHSPDCRYKNCVHLGEPDCAVKEAVKNLKIPLARYDRYAIIYAELMQLWRLKYD